MKVKITVKRWTSRNKLIFFSRYNWITVGQGDLRMNITISLSVEEIRLPFLSNGSVSQSRFERVFSGIWSLATRIFVISRAHCATLFQKACRISESCAYLSLRSIDSICSPIRIVICSIVKRKLQTLLMPRLKITPWGGGTVISPFRLFDRLSPYGLGIISESLSRAFGI